MNSPLLPLLFISLLFFACNRQVATTSIQVLSKDAQGLISVAAEGTGATLPKRELSAQYKILNEIIFNGIPSEKVSDLRLPLVDRRTTLSSGQQKSLDEILSEENRNKYFSMFTRQSSSRQFNAKNNRVERFIGKLRIDLLRTDLENKGIIRKFGL
ncbi:MAG: hypothetical protein ACJAT4_002690 [Granulosicoccus sp.]|jgi:hypothetical protein